VAGYRLGHSMIRPGYRINDNNLIPIFTTPETKAKGFNDDLRGFRAMPPDRAIDWGRFIDIDTRVYDGTDAENKKRLQFAYRIDTSLVNPLSQLPVSVAANPPSLAQRNLERGWRMGLPNGQHVARAIGETPLDEDKILIGKGVDKPDKGESPKPLREINKVFENNCPLWTYILAEAMQNQEEVKVPVKEKVTITTPQLGPVGGRIVAEVFLGLMFGDNHSLLTMEPNWTPKAVSAQNKNGKYELKDFVSYALGEPTVELKKKSRATHA